MARSERGSVMTQNVMELGPQIVGVVVGAVVLLIFGLTVAVPNRPKTLPGSSGHRDPSDQPGHEEIHADGYIDSFAKEIEEAGGALPLIVKLAIPGVLLWWLLYLVLNWAPR
jgi:hypothetical protein